MRADFDSGRFLRRVINSIWQRVLGFAWTFLATLLIVTGVGLGLLGVGGHLLVRARPDTTRVINYDPSRVASFAPVPFVMGCVVFLGFWLVVRRSRR